MSQNDTHDQTSALDIAWQRQVELSTKADEASRRYLRLRDWVIALGVLATLLAILTDVHSGSKPLGQMVDSIFRVGLILAPIIATAVLAFANKFQQGERWLALRTGAEEIKKEIFLYRTILQYQEKREQWLSERVADIQRRVFDAVGGDLILNATGVGSGSWAGQGNRRDPGNTDLLADEYLHYRLEDQLDWHGKKAEGLKARRVRLQVGIYAFGGLSTLLAGLANIPEFGGLGIWVALTSSLGAGLAAWLELRQIDSTITNYSHVTNELQIIRDHWRSLPQAERTGDEFFRLVTATEKVIWSQHNQFISEMRQAVAQLRGEESDILSLASTMPAPTAIDEALAQEALSSFAAAATNGAEEAEPPAEETAADEPAQQPGFRPTRGRPHAFVVMPFGRKQGPDGRWIDFNSIYNHLIRPALEEAGFESFRADEESVSGDILTDMFQELLLADLVIADLSIDNANVFYELGVRHAMRKRGVIHIQSGRSYMPFDIFNVRTIPYTCGPNGKPDPHHLAKEKQTIVQIIRETWASDQARVHSPIFNLLDGLTEPDRQTLQTPLATGYWREHRQWEERVAIARRQKRIGDVLLLTEEVTNPLIQENAIAEAGQALKNLGQHALALEQCRRGLSINPQNARFRREEAFHLGRLQRYDEAIVKLENLLVDDPADIEAVSFLGRIYKEMWLHEWTKIEDDQERLKAAYDVSHLLKRAVDTYLAGYYLDQNHYYSGINALLLSVILDHLGTQLAEKGDVDPETETMRQQLPVLKGAVQFSLEKAARREPNNFWVFASLGDLAVCMADQPKKVARAYKKALALGGKSKFALQSTLSQLEMLASLAFRPDYVAAGLTVLNEALHNAYYEEEDDHDHTGHEPPHVFLFSGHMVDHPARQNPRFPPDMVEEAGQKIRESLDKLEAGAHDLAITAGAACGGDILFIEACLERDMRVEIYLPFNEAAFIEESVSFAGDDWVARFHSIRRYPNVTVHLQPDRLGPVPKGDNSYERNNRWALYSALTYGIERVRLIVLWNGQGGDGPGGTGHMVQEVRRLGGIAEHLDTSKFKYWKAKGKVDKALQQLVDGA
jgi:tetratricopeptide (TPR) repeat protein